MKIFENKFFFDLRIFLSYLGIIPFIFILLDLHLLNLFSNIFIKDFIILYTLLISSFIGAMRWDFSCKANSKKIFYGFLPSLYSSVFIFLYLLNFNKKLIIIIIITFLFLQLILDFFISLKNKDEKKFLFKVRIPLTFLIGFVSFYVIFV